eukprot:jgi/Botrbrau1/12016/Bobra.247_2s0021.1
MPGPGGQEGALCWRLPVPQCTACSCCWGRRTPLPSIRPPPTLSSVAASVLPGLMLASRLGSAKRTRRALKKGHLEGACGATWWWPFGGTGEGHGQVALLVYRPGASSLALSGKNSRHRYAVYAGSGTMSEGVDDVGLADVAAWVATFISGRCPGETSGWPPPPLADEDAPTLGDRLRAWSSDLFWPVQLVLMGSLHFVSFAKDGLFHPNVVVRYTSAGAVVLLLYLLYRRLRKPRQASRRQQSRRAGAPKTAWRPDLDTLKESEGEQPDGDAIWEALRRGAEPLSEAHMVPQRPKSYLAVLLVPGSQGTQSAADPLASPGTSDEWTKAEAEDDGSDAAPGSPGDPGIGGPLGSLPQFPVSRNVECGRRRQLLPGLYSRLRSGPSPQVCFRRGGGWRLGGVAGDAGDPAGGPVDNWVHVPGPNLALPKRQARAFEPGRLPGVGSGPGVGRGDVVGSQLVYSRS